VTDANQWASKEQVRHSELTNSQNFPKPRVSALPPLPIEWARGSREQKKDPLPNKNEAEKELPPEVAARVSAILGSGVSSAESGLIDDKKIFATQKYSKTALAGWLVGGIIIFMGSITALEGISESSSSSYKAGSEIELSIQRVSGSGKMLMGGGMIAAGVNTMMIATICQHTKKNGQKG